MVIAIDLDGVLFDSEEYFRTYAHIYDNQIVKNGLKNIKEMSVHCRHNWTQEIADEFYDKYTAKVLENSPIKPGARYVINRLKELGHTLICVTLRGYYMPCEIEITKRRLKENEIEFDKIFYSQHNKLQVCKDEKVDLVIEDNPKNIKLLANNGIRCLHLRGAGLRKVKQKNVIEVQNWGDILEKIENLTK